MNISENTIFIPGATSGIGLALALALKDKGNTVVVGGRRTELLDQIRAEHGLEAVEIDTASADSIRSAAATVTTTHPDLNVLITMAGIMRAEDWASGDFLDTAEATVTTNILGPIRLIDAFLPQLQSQPEATILTVSSGLAFTPLQFTPTYNASKAAIHMLSETLRLQLADTSVRIQELVPPAVQTDLMPGHRENPMGMPLEEFITEVVELLEAQPEATEIQVERVKFLRYAEARGDYDDVLAALNHLDSDEE